MRELTVQKTMSYHIVSIKDAFVISTIAIYLKTPHSICYGKQVPEVRYKQSVHRMRYENKMQGVEESIADEYRFSKIDALPNEQEKSNLYQNYQELRLI